MRTVWRFRLPSFRALRFRWARRPHDRRGWLRIALGWVPAAYLAAIASGWLVVETAAPDGIDPEYRDQLARTRATTAESPERPLGLVVGGSRTRLAFQRELLVERPQINWVNLSRDGCGPILGRVTLHRLFRDGVRPEVVVLEVMPAEFVAESTDVLGRRLAARDLAVARRYWSAGGLERRYLARRLLHPGAVVDALDADAATVGPPALVDSVSQSEREARYAAEWREYGERARDLTIAPGANRALRDSLAEAAGHDVRVVLLYAPEGPVFRSWYGPHARARFDAYIRETAAEFQVPLIDAREWLAEDEFLDSHHVLKSGAAAFSTRLARDVEVRLGVAH